MWHLGFVRELKIFLNNSNLWLLSFLFYLMIVLSAPMALTYSSITLNDFAPTIMWLTFILANIQLTANIFVNDHKNGWYQQIFVHHKSPKMYFFYKMLATTLVFIVPISFITPVLALTYNLAWQEILVIYVGIWLAAPGLCFLNGIFAALAVASHHRGGLLNVLMLPLCLPIYILGVGSSQLFAHGFKPYAALSLLAAISLLAMLLAPYLITLSIRNSFEY